MAAWTVYNGRGHRRDAPAARGINVYQHHGDGTFTVARDEVWCDGVYDSLRAAALATRLDPGVLARLWTATRKRGDLLTEADIKRALDAP